MVTYQKLIQEAEPGTLLYGGARMALLEIEAGFWGLRRQLEALVGRRLATGVLHQAGVNGGAAFARAFIASAPASDSQETVGEALRDCIAAYQAAGFGRFTVTYLDWPLGRIAIDAVDAFEAWMIGRHHMQTDEPVCAYSAGVLVGFINALTGRTDIVCREIACQAQGSDSCRFELLPATEAGEKAVVAYDPDPLLGRQLNLLDLLFDRMPMGIVIFDRDLRVRRFNPTWAEYIGRYTPSETGQVLPGARFFDLAPGTEPSMEPVLKQVLAGETVVREAMPSESGGILSYWDVVFSPLFEDGQVVGVLDVTIDATARVEAQRNLEQLVEERTRQISTLLQISYDVASTLELDLLLEQILEQLKQVVDYSGATILTLEGDELVVLAHRGPIPQEKAAALRFPFEQAASRDVILKQEVQIVPDVWADTHLAQAYRSVGAYEMRSTFNYVQSWMAVPMVVKNEVIGILSLDHSQVGYYNEHHAELARAFANQVAVSIENARLYQQEQERRQVAESLRDILQVLNSDRPLDEILLQIVQQAKMLLAADACVLYRNDDESGRVVIEASTGLPDDFKGIDSLPLDAASSLGMDAVADSVLSYQPLAISDVQEAAASGPAVDMNTLPAEVRRWQVASAKHYRAFLVTPLVIKDELFGSLGFHYVQPRRFPREDVHLAGAFGDQAALAIENARLHEQAERSAVVEERNRLARELHDAVTQTLFSASLIADVLPRLWDKNPDEGRRRLEELGELTRGALAEMRAMLLELRPSALAQYSLADLLRQLAEAHAGRARLPVDVSIHGQEQTLPEETQSALYRIAQESLNNVAKHAGPCQVVVALSYEPLQVSLTIEDNGRGFDPAHIGVQSLGLGIMRERAERLGGTLAIESEMGVGTRVVARSPLPKRVNNERE
jgi:signal transduction histidine kinase/putative methionine-R-sulfoxide reductase with GAF domain/predicted hydrocarbon binding protein